MVMLACVGMHNWLVPGPQHLLSDKALGPAWISVLRVRLVCVKAFAKQLLFINASALRFLSSDLQADREALLQ